MKLFFLFTTGRTGTGYLSQVFGHARWSKRGLHFVHGKHLVTHEPWNDIPVQSMKATDLYGVEPQKIGLGFIEKKIREIQLEYPFGEVLFITDHKIGRYFGPAIAKSDVDFRVVYVERNENEVAASFLRKTKEKRDTLDEKRFNRYFDRLWAANKYHPSDAYIAARPSDDEWNAASERQRYRWYHQEVRRQWTKLKRLLSRIGG